MDTQTAIKPVSVEAVARAATLDVVEMAMASGFVPKGGNPALPPKAIDVLRDFLADWIEANMEPRS